MNTKRMFGEASLALCGATLGLVLLAPSAIAATTDAAAMQLVSKYNCQTCHTVDKKLVGPSYKEVAAKYAGDKAALAKLEEKVKQGGSGVWGPIPMPPNAVPEADLKSLVEWILALK
jgi:cytochrome c